MFFPRLRRHAKWMFLFLALVFGLGFVGSASAPAGSASATSSATQLAAADSRPSRMPNRSVLDNPKDAKAFRDLSTAQQAAGNTDDAIEALQSYAQLRPKNTDALRELAALYLQQASAAQERAQIYQARSDFFAPGGIRDTLFQVGDSPLTPDPITNAVSTTYDQQVRPRSRRSSPRPLRQSISTAESPRRSRRIRASSSNWRRLRSRRTTTRPPSRPTRRS